MNPPEVNGPNLYDLFAFMTGLKANFASCEPRDLCPPLAWMIAWMMA